MKKFYNNTLIGGAFSKALRVIALLCVLLGVSSSAWGTTIYMRPSNEFKTDNARFAAYFFESGEIWVDMTDPDGDGVFQCEIPSGSKKVIFCRMNPSTNVNNWDNGVKWNQTGDQEIPTDGRNLFNVSGWGDGSWDNTPYTPSGGDTPSTGGHKGTNLGFWDNEAWNIKVGNNWSNQSGYGAEGNTEIPLGTLKAGTTIGFWAQTWKKNGIANVCLPRVYVKILKGETTIQDYAWYELGWGNKDSESDGSINQLWIDENVLTLPNTLVAGQTYKLRVYFEMWGDENSNSDVCNQLSYKLNNGEGNYNFSFTIQDSGSGGGGTGGDTGDCTTLYLNNELNLWDTNNGEFYIYYWSASGDGWKKLKSASSCPKIFYGSIPNDVTGYKYVRLKNSGNPGWDRKDKETGDLSLSEKHQYKLTSLVQGQSGTNGSYENVSCNETDSDCEGGGSGDDDDDDNTSDCDYIEVWCKGSNKYVTMNCYAWDANENKLLGEWPGQKTDVTDIYTDGAKYAIWKFSNTDNINIIFNNGSSQTANITGLRKGNRYVYNLKDDWSYDIDSEILDCSLPATNILLAREANVDVVAKTATVYGYLKNNPDCAEITDYGFYFCTTADGAAACTPVANENFKWSATSTDILPRGKEFSANVAELYDGTTYYYRAYAVIGEETVLSQEVRSITTEPCKAQKAGGDPVIYTVDATFASDNVCKLYFRDVQKAINHLKGSFANEEDYRYVSVESGSYNLNQPVVINVRYYDDSPSDPTSAYAYRGTTQTGMTAGNVAPTHVNLIEDINKNATNKANILTIKAGNNKAKPWVHHIVIRNSKNITLDSLCIYSDPTGLKDNALEIDVNSSNWPSITPSFTDANITISNCMIGSAGFTGLHVSGYDGITFKGNDIEASFADESQRKNTLNWGASAKFVACKNIKFIQNNFRGSQPTLLWIQDSENALFMNNVFWNTNTFLANSGEVTPTAIKLVSQYGKDINNIGFFYNTFFFANNGKTSTSKYNFFTEYLAAANGSNAQASFFKDNIYFQYNNCYSYDVDCPGKDAFLGKGSGDGENVSFSIQSSSTSNANFCPNNFWSVLDGEGRSTFDFTTGCDITKINVKDQVCETTASGPASLIIKGIDLNLGSAPVIDSTRIKLEADEQLADRYLVGVRPSGEGWTYGAYQTREAKDVKTIYWVGVTDSWDDRNNWEFEVKNNDKIVRQRVSCVENLSEDLHVVIEEIGTVEVTGGRKWPRLPESFDQEARFQESGIPVAEQVNAGNTNKFADHIELEYGAGIIGVESLKNGELHYTRASNKLISPRSEWILVGPTIKPFDEKTPSTDDVREVVSGDYFIKNHEPHVYMHKAKFLDDGISVGWDATFADLNTPLTANTVYAMQIPDEYGPFKLPAELHYAYISPNPSMVKDAIVSKEFSFEGRFYNEDALPTYTGLIAGHPVLISNTYPANIDAYKFEQLELGTIQIYDYEAKSFGPLKAKASTPILSQHGFVFTPATNDDLVITSDYFLHTLTKRAAEVTEPYCRINVKNMKSNASSDIEVEFDELKEDVANYATDAPKAFNSMEKSLPDMYVMRYDKKWAEVTIPTMSEAIPLGIRISETGTTIRFSYVDSEGLGDVILEDRLTGETYNLSIGQVCTVSDLPVGDCENRFFLNLSEKDMEDNEDVEDDVTTDVEEESSADSGISIIGFENSVLVSCSTDMELQYIYINDMSGKTAMYKVSGQYIKIDMSVAQGVYTVNVITDKANKTGKVILK